MYRKTLKIIHAVELMLQFMFHINFLSGIWWNIKFFSHRRVWKYGFIRYVGAPVCNTYTLTMKTDRYTLPQIQIILKHQQLLLKRIVF